MKTITIAMPLLVGLAFALPGHADHGCNGTVTQVDVGAETLYVDDRSTSDQPFRLFFYMEQNGVEGLQTGGDSAVFSDQEVYFTDYACDHVNPDRLLLPTVT